MAAKRRKQTVSPERIRVLAAKAQQKVNWIMGAAERGNCHTAINGVTHLYQHLGNIEVDDRSSAYEAVEAVVLRGSARILDRCGIRPKPVERAQPYSQEAVYGKRFRDLSGRQVDDAIFDLDVRREHKAEEELRLLAAYG